MKFAAIMLLVLAILTDPAKIGKINRTKEEAKKAYQAGEYKLAVEKYTYLRDSLHVHEDEIQLNLAHAQFQLNDTSSARGSYQPLTESRNNQIRSTAQQQLGVLANRQGKFEEALTHFKEALKADPANNDARYNYELVKQKLDNQKKQEQQQQNQQRNDQQQKQDQKKQENQDKKKDQNDQQNKDQSKSDQSKSDQQKKDEQQKQNEQQNEQQSEQQKDEKKEAPSSVSEKLEQLKISEEKAKMLLEAMKNQEMQYLQQNKRKPTKPKDNGKPDW
jgi:Ca-activated chloride channel family protein